MEKIIQGGIGVVIQITPNRFLHYLIDDITITDAQMRPIEIWKKVGGFYYD